MRLLPGVTSVLGEATHQAFYLTLNVYAYPSFLDADKSFLTEKEAQDFVAGKSKSTPGQEKFYGVAVGHKPGVYTEWTEAQMQILGAEKPKYKKFDNRKEAEAFVKSGGIIPVKKAAMAAMKDEDNSYGRTAKKQKSSSVLRVYTDGSALGNGKTGAIAGVGVFFGVGDERNVSEPLEGKIQTNNRAELTGVLRALEIAPENRDMEIVTDSSYAINCVTLWYKSWACRGWRKNNGEQAENQDLIKDIRKLIDTRDALGKDTQFTWIKGHNDDPGNTAADRLAVAGAQNAQAARR
ncbi:hypothetical protein B2J93_2910 [Marssonina coronariae]|uniref:Ribonuclease H n=1 Tax=Diplocarpon coronariae TaxID=2795749 RepID=A0A218YUB8_9HELO|nr:hypothetical protein B2J93_2910 [Marssonina coronariae]